MPDIFKILAKIGLLFFLSCLICRPSLAQDSKQHSDRIQKDTTIEGALWCTSLPSVSDIALIGQEKYISVLTESRRMLIDTRSGETIKTWNESDDAGFELTRNAITADDTYLYRCLMSNRVPGIPSFIFQLHRTRLDDLTTTDTLAFEFAEISKYTAVQEVVALPGQTGKVLISFKYYNNQFHNHTLEESGKLCLFDTEASVDAESRICDLDIGMRSGMFISPMGDYALKFGTYEYSGFKRETTTAIASSLMHTTFDEFDTNYSTVMYLPRFNHAMWAANGEAFVLLTDTQLSHYYTLDTKTQEWVSHGDFILNSPGVLLRYGRHYLQFNKHLSQLQLIDLLAGEAVNECALNVDNIQSMLISADQRTLYILTASGRLAAIPMCSELLTVTDVRPMTSPISSGLRVAPNPTNSSLYVTHPGVSNGTIRVMDLTAREVLRLPANKQQTTQIDVSQLPPGTYALELINGVKRHQQLFIRY